MLIANAQERFVARGGMGLIARWDDQYPQMVGRAAMGDALQEDEFKAYRRLGEIDPGLPPSWPPTNMGTWAP